LDHGAVATVGVDFYSLGWQTADLLLKVLEGADPATLAIQEQNDPEILVDNERARRLGIDLEAIRLPEGTDIRRLPQE
jgi:putative ABC transport system substrate-binding protein